MAQPNVGTPDGQRGVVSAQKVIGTFKTTDSVGTVGVPPNCETIIIAFASGHKELVSSVAGGTTGILYPLIPYTAPDSNGMANAWLAAVDPSADDQVTVELTEAPGFAWYVTSDQFPRMVVDSQVGLAVIANGRVGNGVGLTVMGNDSGGTSRLIRTDTNGRLAAGDPNVPGGVIPEVPTAGAEANGISTFPHTLIAAPGSGANYLFGLELGVGTTTAAWVVLVDDATGDTICSSLFTAQSAGTDYVQSPSMNLHRYRATGNVKIEIGAGGVSTALFASTRYAPGP